MNTLGKIAMGFLIAFLLFATYLTTGVLKARSTWVKKVEDLTTQITKAETDLKSAKKRFEDVRNQLHWENDNWGRAWQADNSGPSPAGNGSVELGIGSNAGLKADKPPLVYLFGKNAEGKSLYLGDFQLTEVRQDSSGGALTRPLYAGELESWPRGEYRVREQVPYDHLSTIDALRTLILLADQNVQHEQRMLAIQNEHVTTSQAALDERMGELNGKPDAPEQAGPDVKDGLVQSLRREENARNEQVKVVDALRRELSDQHLKLVKMLEGNRGNLENLTQSAQSGVTSKKLVGQKPKAVSR